MNLSEFGTFDITLATHETWVSPVRRDEPECQIHRAREWRLAKMEAVWAFRCVEGAVVLQDRLQLQSEGRRF